MKKGAFQILDTQENTAVEVGNSRKLLQTAADRLNAGERRMISGAVQPEVSTPPAAEPPGRPSVAAEAAGAKGETPDVPDIKVLPAYLNVGDRIWTIEDGYITVEKVLPFNPKYPKSQQVETSKGQRDFAPDNPLAVSRPATAAGDVLASQATRETPAPAPVATPPAAETSISKPAYRDIPSEFAEGSSGRRWRQRMTITEDQIASAKRTAEVYDAPVYIGGEKSVTLGRGSERAGTRPSVRRQMPQYLLATVFPDGRVELENNAFRPQAQVTLPERASSPTTPVAPEATETAPPTGTASAESIGDRLAGKRSGIVGTVTHLGTGTKTQMRLRPDPSEMGKYSVEVVSKNGIQSSRMGYKGTMSMSEALSDFEDYLNTDRPGTFKVEDALGRKPAAVVTVQPEAPTVKAEPVATAIPPKGKARTPRKLMAVGQISDFRVGTDKVVRRGDRTFIVDSEGQRAETEVQSDVMQPEHVENLRKLTPAQLDRMEQEIRNTHILSEEGRSERLKAVASIRGERTPPAAEPPGRPTVAAEPAGAKAAIKSDAKKRGVKALMDEPILLGGEVYTRGNAAKEMEAEGLPQAAIDKFAFAAETLTPEQVAERGGLKSEQAPPEAEPVGEPGGEKRAPPTVEADAYERTTPRKGTPEREAADDTVYLPTPEQRARMSEAELAFVDNLHGQIKELEGLFDIFKYHYLKGKWPDVPVDVPLPVPGTVPLYKARVVSGVIVRDQKGVNIGSLSAGTIIDVYSEHVNYAGYPNRVVITPTGAVPQKNIWKANVVRED